MRSRGVAKNICVVRMRSRGVAKKVCVVRNEVSRSCEKSLCSKNERYGAILVFRGVVAGVAKAN